MKKWLIMIAGVIMLICISVPVLASDTLETANTVIGVSVYNLNDAEVSISKLSGKLHWHHV